MQSLLKEAYSLCLSLQALYQGKLSQGKLSDASPNIFSQITEFQSCKMLCPAQTLH